jgi:hypothetical protein
MERSVDAAAWTPPTAEAHLLLAVARAWVAGTPLAAPAAMDWNAFASLAEAHGLLPLVDHVLRAAGVPHPLHARATERVRGTFHLTGELLALSDAFEAAGVVAVPYKGPVLALQAYGSLAMRQFTDLDVLVRPGEMERASAVLHARGYEPAYQFTPVQDALFRRVDGDYPFAHPETGVLVEVHTRVSSRRFLAELETDDLVAGARPLALGGREVPALATEDLLLVLAVHGSKHRWYRLEWVVGIAALLRRHPVDWPALLERAARAHALRVLLLALVLARDLAGARLPPAVAERADADRVVARLAGQVLREMFALHADPEETRGNLLFNLRAKDGWVDRARYAARWAIIATPEDWSAVPLPDVLFPLYTLVRPLRLLARYGVRRRGGGGAP